MTFSDVDCGRQVRGFFLIHDNCTLIEHLSMVMEHAAMTHINQSDGDGAPHPKNITYGDECTSSHSHNLGIPGFSPMTTDVSSTLIRSAQRYDIVRYITVASAALLVYDWATLLPVEVEHVWKRKLTSTKALYLLSRYLPCIDVTLTLLYYLDPDLSPTACRWTYSVGVWFTGVGMALAELVMCIRTHAICARSWKIKWILAIIWMAWVCGNIPVIFLFTNSIKMDKSTNPATPGCQLVGGSPIVFGSYLSLLAFEIFIVVLTVKQGLFHLRQSRLGRNRMVAVLYRDGILFFIFMASASLSNALVMALAPAEFIDLLDTFLRISHSLLTCRILLNLRQAAMETLFGDSESSGVTYRGEHRGAALARRHETSALAFATPQPNTMLTSQEESIALNDIASA